MLTLLLPLYEHHQAPQGPDRKDMTYLKKKKKIEGGMKTTSPMKTKKKKKAPAFYISFYNDSFRDSLCARDKDTLTLSASVTEVTNGCWRGVATAKRPSSLVYVLICVYERECAMAGSFVCDLMSRGLYDNEYEVFPH